MTHLFSVFQFKMSMYDLDNERKRNPEGRKDWMTERDNTICLGHFMAGAQKQPTKKLKIIIVWNQYTLFDSSRFIHSDCGSSLVKMYMPTGEHCWKKNSGLQWPRTSNLLSYIGRYVEWDLNFYCTVLYIAPMLFLTAEPRGRPVASSMFNIIFN